MTPLETLSSLFLFPLGRSEFDAVVSNGVYPVRTLHQ